MFKEDIAILTALANGVNYFTGEKCKEDSILNDVNLIRAIFNLAEKLKDITPKKVKKSEFQFDVSILDNFEYEDRFMSLSEILKKVSLITPTMKRVKYSQVFDVLNRKGLLVKTQDSSGVTRTLATENAEEYGIKNLEKTSMYGRKYSTVGYNVQGQKYILSILNEVE